MMVLQLFGVGGLRQLYAESFSEVLVLGYDDSVQRACYEQTCGNKGYVDASPGVFSETDEHGDTWYYAKLDVTVGFVNYNFMVITWTSGDACGGGKKWTVSVEPQQQGGCYGVTAVTKSGEVRSYSANSTYELAMSAAYSMQANFACEPTSIDQLFGPGTSQEMMDDLTAPFKQGTKPEGFEPCPFTIKWHEQFVCGSSPEYPCIGDPFPLFDYIEAGECCVPDPPEPCQPPTEGCGPGKVWSQSNCACIDNPCPGLQCPEGSVPDYDFCGCKDPEGNPVPPIPGPPGGEGPQPNPPNPGPQGPGPGDGGPQPPPPTNPNPGPESPNPGPEGPGVPPSSPGTDPENPSPPPGPEWPTPPGGPVEPPEPPIPTPPPQPPTTPPGEDGLGFGCGEVFDAEGCDITNGIEAGENGTIIVHYSFPRQVNVGTTPPTFQWVWAFALEEKRAFKSADVAGWLCFKQGQARCLPVDVVDWERVEQIERANSGTDNNWSSLMKAIRASSCEAGDWSQGANIHEGTLNCGTLIYPSKVSQEMEDRGDIDELLHIMDKYTSGGSAAQTGGYFNQFLGSAVNSIDSAVRDGNSPYGGMAASVNGVMADWGEAWAGASSATGDIWTLKWPTGDIQVNVWSFIPGNHSEYKGSTTWFSFVNNIFRLVITVITCLYFWRALSPEEVLK